MFGNVSDKTKREAYLTALSEEGGDFYSPKTNNASMEPAEESAKKNKPQREIVSGKEAIKLANKNISITGSYNKNAIIDENKTVNMSYYSNWRDRLSEIEKAESQKKQINNLQETTASAQNEGTNFGDKLKPSYSGDEFGREPGLMGDDATLLPEKKTYSSSKDLLDSLYSSNTKEEDDNSSLFDSLFKTRTDESVSSSTPMRPSFLNKRFMTSYRDSGAEKDSSYPLGINDSYLLNDDDDEDDDLLDDNSDIEENKDDYTLDDFEEGLPKSFEDIAKTSYKVNADVVREEPKVNKAPIKTPVATKPATKKTPAIPRKRKKKYDADIIGDAGFFTA